MRGVLEYLWQIQVLDLKILALRDKAFIVPELKAKQDELTRIRIQEQQSIQGLAEQRAKRTQASEALESCRQRLMRAESAVKEIKSSEVFQATVKEIDQLRTFEESLESKQGETEKEAEALSAKLAGIQSQRVALECDLENLASLKASKDLEIETAIREIVTGGFKSEVQHLSMEILAAC